MGNFDAQILFDFRELGGVAYPDSPSSFCSDEPTVPDTAPTAKQEEPIMAFSRLLALTLLILSFAANAHAGVQMYSGEMIVHMRGSDAAGDFVAVPFGRQCNIIPTHFPFTYTSGTRILTIPQFGGQVPVIDTDSDSIPDVATGCAPASLHTGLPLSGSGVLATTGNASTARTVSNPRDFTIPMSDLSRVTSGASFLSESTFLPLGLNAPFFFEIENASLKNAAGGFSNGGGPGNFTVSHAGTSATVRVNAGKNQFGGTMRLLGHYRTKRGIISDIDGTNSAGSTPWNLQYIGAGAAVNRKGVVTGGLKYYTMTTRLYQIPGATPYDGTFGTSPRSATISVFPWTTGTAEVNATGGIRPTVLKRTGYDNRTPAGKGIIQMVSPALARWKNPFGDYYTGNIATIKLVFIPEPKAWMMLVAGVSTLALLYRANRQRGCA
jgi:hypothetical protein